MAEEKTNDTSTHQQGGQGEAKTDAQNADQKAEGATGTGGDDGVAAEARSKGADGGGAEGKDSATGTDAAKADDPTKDKGGDKPQPPEKYDLKLSEGSVLESDAVDQIAAYAKQQGWSQEDAAKHLAAVEERAMQDRNARVEKWNEAVKSDKDLGGKNLAATQANITRFAQKFTPAGSDIRELLERTGYGSHPAVARLMNDIGKAMADDKPGAGGQAHEEKQDERLADQLYGSTTPKAA